MSKKIVRHIPTDCCYYTEEDGKTVIICGARLTLELDGKFWEEVSEYKEKKVIPVDLYAAAGVNDMSKKKQYLIDEDTLRELLHDSHKLAILERDGVDNWTWYMTGLEEYIAECAAMLPWNEGKSAEDLKVLIEDEDYYIDNLVDDQIDAFWEAVE